MLYSDGISEAMSPGREEFGEKRLVALLQEHRKEPAARLTDRVFEAVAGHAGGTPQSDDMTLLIIKRLRSGEAG